MMMLRFFFPFTRYDYQGHLSSCPVCGADEATEIANMDRNLKFLRTVMCNHCGLAFTNPLPTDEELSLFYKKYYRAFYQMAFSKPKQKHIAKRTFEANQRSKAISGLKAGDRTLDFGCGSGEFVKTMLDLGYDAHGFEIGESYGSYGKGKLGSRIKVSGWQEVNYKPDFDLITCFHVVEHLRDPLNAVRKMISWTAPGGLIYLEVPNIAADPNKGFGFFHFAHVLGFNTWNFRLMCATLGLVPVKAVSPTGIIFKKGNGGDREALARRGHEISVKRFVEQSAYRAYFRYQIWKVRGRPKMQ